MTGGGRRRLLPVLLLAVVALLGALAPAAGLARQVPGDAVVAQATLTDVRPAFLTQRDETLTLQGVVRNVSDAPLVDPLPVLRWSLDALQSVDEVDLVTSDPLFRYGRVDYSVTASLPTLAPGEQAPFTLQVPLPAQLPGPGVYVVGVDVLATLPDGLRVFVAAARTTVAFDVPPRPALPVALLWPLAADPSLLPDGRLVDDSVAAQLAPGGRLDTLVSAPGAAPVTWVVDPDLLSTTAAMRDGYDTVDPPGPGTGAGDASRFDAALAGVLRPTSDVRRLPTADPDVGGLVSSGWDAGRCRPTGGSTPPRSTPTVLRGCRPRCSTRPTCCRAPQLPRCGSPTSRAWGSCPRHAWGDPSRGCCRPWRCSNGCSP